MMDPLEFGKRTLASLDRNKIFLVMDFDLCICGDFRFQHVEGRGQCTMSSDPSHHKKPCWEFDLGEAATKFPEWLKESVG